MLLILCFVICLAASVIGAICGIGGGVIIKPLLDATGVFSVATISFLSTCTVLSMTSYSVIKSRIEKRKDFSFKIGIPLALGAAFGGILGKKLFTIVKNASEDVNKVGAVQAICLLLVTLFTLIYTINKDKINTLHVKNIFACVLIGLVLGIMSSFLGIGGGPINLVVLFFFFSMSTKIAAEYSLYIIFFSMLMSVVSSLITKNIPDFSWPVLILMISGGVAGGILGRFINAKIKENTVTRLFIILMIVMIAINVYNIFKYI